MRLDLIRRTTYLVSVLTTVSCGSFDSTTPTTADNTVAAAVPLTAAEEAALEKEYAALPKGIMVRVPVGTDGKEKSESAEIRAYSGSDLTEAKDAESAWNTATTATELDRDSSSESYGDATPANYRELGLANNPQTQNGGYGQNGGQGQHGGYGQNGGQGQHGGYGQNGGHGQRGGYGHNRGHGQSYGHGGWGGYYGGYYRGYNPGYSYYYPNYYTSYYRPAWYSSAYYGGYWGYNTNPYCYNWGGYNYYYYARPSCSIYTWCGSYYY